MLNEQAGKFYDAKWSQVVFIRSSLGTHTDNDLEPLGVVLMEGKLVHGNFVLLEVNANCNIFDENRARWRGSRHMEIFLLEVTVNLNVFNVNRDDGDDRRSFKFQSCF